MEVMDPPFLDAVHLRLDELLENVLKLKTNAKQEFNTGISG